MPEFYTWVILLIKQSEELSEKQLSVLGFRGGQISPLMHVALSSCQQAICDRAISLKAAALRAHCPLNNRKDPDCILPHLKILNSFLHTNV